MIKPAYPDSFTTNGGSFNTLLGFRNVSCKWNTTENIKYYFWKILDQFRDILNDIAYDSDKKELQNEV